MNYIVNKAGFSLQAVISGEPNSPFRSEKICSLELSLAQIFVSNAC